MSLGGGFGNIEDLKEGEGEYVSDYLDHCWIAGMKRADLEDVLGLCGMTLETEINMYSTVISGQVEDNNVSLLMKSLLAMLKRTLSCAKKNKEVAYV